MKEILGLRASLQWVHGLLLWNQSAYLKSTVSTAKQASCISDCTVLRPSSAGSSGIPGDTCKTNSYALQGNHPVCVPTSVSDTGLSAGVQHAAH